jgi:uncharacterized membrane protein
MKIIARTDALGITGIYEVLDRAAAFVEAGAMQPLLTLQKIWLNSRLFLQAFKHHKLQIWFLEV